MDFMDGFVALCRLCLKLGHNDSIFKKGNALNALRLSEMAMECARVKIYLRDGLPDKICYDCEQKLCSAYIFKEQCERSEKALRQDLIDSPSANITKNRPRASSLDVSAHQTDNEISSLRKKERFESRARKRRCESDNEATLGSPSSNYRRPISASTPIDELRNKSMPMTPQEHSSTNTTVEAYSVDVAMSYFLADSDEPLVNTCLDTSKKKCLREFKDFYDSFFDSMKSPARNTGRSLGEAEEDIPRNNVDAADVNSKNCNTAASPAITYMNSYNEDDTMAFSDCDEPVVDGIPNKNAARNTGRSLGEAEEDIPRNNVDAVDVNDNMNSKNCNTAASPANTYMNSYNEDDTMRDFEVRGYDEFEVDGIPNNNAARNTGSNLGEAEEDIPRNNVDAADINDNLNSKNCKTAASPANTYMNSYNEEWDFEAVSVNDEPEVDGIPNNNAATNTGRSLGEAEEDIPRNNGDGADVNDKLNSKKFNIVAPPAKTYMNSYNEDDTRWDFEAVSVCDEPEDDGIPKNNVTTDNDGNLNCTNCNKTFRLQTMLKNHLESCVRTPQTLPWSSLQVPLKELRVVLEPIDKLLKQKEKKNNKSKTAAETANAAVADTGVKSLPCLYCSMTFEEYYVHNAHFNACPQRDVSLPYRCPRCNIVMAKEATYLLHIKKIHFYPKPTKPTMALRRKQKKSKPEHCCRVCDTKLASNNVLIEHLQIHLPKYP